jgi:hypothetical protein
MSASHRLSYKLDSVQTLSQSASSSHHHRLSLQRAPETETPWTRPLLVAAQQPVAEMSHGDAACLLPSCAPGAAGGLRVGSFLVSFPVAAAHVVSVLIAWPWADSKRQDHHEGSPRSISLEDLLRIRQLDRAPATGLAAETPDDGKDLECASLPVCLKPSDGRRGQYPKSCTPSSYDDPRSFLLSFSRPRRRSRDDTEIGRSWCTAKWG